MAAVEVGNSDMDATCILRADPYHSPRIGGNTTRGRALCGARAPDAGRRALEGAPASAGCEAPGGDATCQRAPGAQEP